MQAASMVNEIQSKAKSLLINTCDQQESTIHILAKKNEAVDFADALPQLLKHLKYGEIKKGKSYGIHFFVDGLHRVRESINPANKQGIWEAKIDVRHPKTNAWVQKVKSSTLFPITWSESMLTIKLTEAYLNSKQVTSYKHCGKTDCGIPIVFVLQNKVITSCFPVLK